MTRTMAASIFSTGPSDWRLWLGRSPWFEDERTYRFEAANKRYEVRCLGRDGRPFREQFKQVAEDLMENRIIDPEGMAMLHRELRGRYPDRIVPRLKRERLPQEIIRIGPGGVFFNRRGVIRSLLRRPPKIYFIQAVSGGPVKIGKTMGPEKRLRGLQTAASEMLILQGTITTRTRLTESALHERFRSARIRGEWFRPSPELVGFCRKRGINLCDGIGGSRPPGGAVAAALGSSSPSASNSLAERGGFEPPVQALHPYNRLAIRRMGYRT